MSTAMPRFDILTEIADLADALGDTAADTFDMNSWCGTRRCIIGHAMDMLDSIKPLLVPCDCENPVHLTGLQHVGLDPGTVMRGTPVHVDAFAAVRLGMPAISAALQIPVSDAIDLFSARALHVGVHACRRVAQDIRAYVKTHGGCPSWTISHDDQTATARVHPSTHRVEAP